MRFMIIVKATRDSEAGVMPEEKLMAEMATFHEELQEAGVLLDASGLQPSSKGWRIRFDGKSNTIVDGPFAETKELGPSDSSCRSRDGAIARAGQGARSVVYPLWYMSDRATPPCARKGPSLRVVPQSVARGVVGLGRSVYYCLSPSALPATF